MRLFGIGWAGAMGLAAVGGCSMTTAEPARTMQQVSVTVASDRLGAFESPAVSRTADLEIPSLDLLGAPAVEQQGDGRPAVRPYTDFDADDSVGGLERARRANRERTGVVQELFEEADVAFPPEELLLRAYKSEREMEVWATGEPGGEMKHVTTYEICAASGELGPKRMEGDGQVPEGFYSIQYLWPQSAYHLAMKVGYPNVSDRILGHPQFPGSDIMIHGACASIGCLAMSDERIQELWVMASAAGSSDISVIILPTRDREMLTELPSYAEHAAFWGDIYAGSALFEKHRRPPTVRVDWTGRYEFSAPAT